MSIDIAINPNTKIPSVAIRMTGYFGVSEDGLKLVDSDTVFQESQAKIVARLPSEAFASLQENTTNNGEITDKDPSNGRFVLGNGLSTGRPKGAKNKSKNPLAEKMREVAEQKHYEIKGTGKRVVAYDIMAEMIVDEIVQKKNHRMLETFLDRTEGKVTQGVRVSGAIGTASTEEAMKKIREIFPEDYAPARTPIALPVAEVIAKVIEPEHPYEPKA